jgi:hypothetical protein
VATTPVRGFLGGWVGGFLRGFLGGWVGMFLL